jgi:hypothetical protein
MMSTEIWQTPVEVAVDTGDHFKCVHNSREALEALLTCWPDKGGRSYALAKRACLSALNGDEDPIVAARSFQEAAKEAGILRV